MVLPAPLSIPMLLLVGGNFNYPCSMDSVPSMGAGAKLEQLWAMDIASGMWQVCFKLPHHFTLPSLYKTAVHAVSRAPINLGIPSPAEIAAVPGHQWQGMTPDVAAQIGTTFQDATHGFPLARSHAAVAAAPGGNKLIMAGGLAAEVRGLQQ